MTNKTFKEEVAGALALIIGTIGAYLMFPKVITMPWIMNSNLDDAGFLCLCISYWAICSIIVGITAYTALTLWEKISPKYFRSTVDKITDILNKSYDRFAEGAE